jgi:hypothetical protein
MSISTFTPIPWTDAATTFFLADATRDISNVQAGIKIMLEAKKFNHSVLASYFGMLRVQEDKSFHLPANFKRDMNWYRAYEQQGMYLANQLDRQFKDFEDPAMLSNMKKRFDAQCPCTPTTNGGWHGIACPSLQYIWFRDDIEEKRQSVARVRNDNYLLLQGCRKVMADMWQRYGELQTQLEDMRRRLRYAMETVDACRGAYLSQGNPEGFAFGVAVKILEPMIVKLTGLNAGDLGTLGAVAGPSKLTTQPGLSRRDVESTSEDDSSSDEASSEISRLLESGSAESSSDESSSEESSSEEDDSDDDDDEQHYMSGDIADDERDDGEED